MFDAFSGDRSQRPTTSLNNTYGGSGNSGPTSTFGGTPRTGGKRSGAGSKKHDHFALSELRSAGGIEVHRVVNVDVERDADSAHHHDHQVSYRANAAARPLTKARRCRMTRRLALTLWMMHPAIRRRKRRAVLCEPRVLLYTISPSVGRSGPMDWAFFKRRSPLVAQLLLGYSFSCGKGAVYLLFTICKYCHPIEISCRLARKSTSST